MKKQLLKISIVTTLLFASEALLAQDQKTCGTNKRLKEIYAKDPSLERDHAEFIERIFKSQIKDHGVRSGTSYTIPVVFHIIHEYGEENISDAQVQNQMQILNEDFNKLNADTSLVIAEFDSLIANCHINFKLATLDPDGKCTNGIEHIFSHETREGDDFSKLHLWPRNKYLNVWVVNKMEDNLAGYAYYPSAAAGPLAFADGIIILDTHIGNMGTSSPEDSRSLTHEIGHYLNLPHTWGNTNDNNVSCGNDGIPDTPETAGSPTGVCDLALSECVSGIIENVQNFMDYSYCSNMFTLGQALVMETSLNSSIAYRSNLWQPENLAITGTDVLVAPLCAPVADFNPSEKYICLGDNVTFNDFSWRAPVGSYAWTFPGGTSTMLTSANPVVTYNTPGWHDAILTVTNAAGTDTKTFVNAVYVSNNYTDFTGATAEDFENSTTEPWWIVDNPEANESKWSRVSIPTAPSGSYCFMLNNYKDPASDFLYANKLGGNIDGLISPSYDLSTTTGSVLSFKYSCATHAAIPEDLTEELNVYVSIDCGKNWSLRKTIKNVDLANAGTSGGNFIPLNNTTFWRTETINLGSSVVEPNVRFKFEYLASDKSNNIFIDDINVNGVVGISNTPAIPFAFDVYPNPVNGSGNLTVEYSNETGKMHLKVMDVLGNVLFAKTSTSNGDKIKLDIPLNALNVSKGLYFISLSNEVFEQTRKVIVE